MQINDKNNIDIYIKFVKPHYKNRNVAHDFSHLERIVRRLAPLSKGVEASLNKPLLYFLACFHELSSKVRKDKVFRSEIDEFLSKCGWQENEISEAFLSLERHINNPQKIEEEIIHDANFIEVFGALGIAKAFTTGGVKQQSYEETVEFLESYINKVQLKTAVGKSMQKKLIQRTNKFLCQIKEEW